MESRGAATNTITFLGTGGARFMIIHQFLASGGMWFNLDDTEMLVDPGPGCIVQSTKRKLRAERLSAIIVSHRHLDHSADANVMVEAMTNGGLKRHGKFLAPADALSDEPIIYSYLRKNLESVETLEAGKKYDIDGISLATPIRHIHQVDTFGMVFRSSKYTISYVADTRYFEELGKAYSCDLLIMNVAFLEPRPPGSQSLPTDHLSAPDAVRLIMAIKPKAAIMTHFGMNMWRAHPWEVAELLSRETGVKVIAARDGMKFDLATLDNPA
jgi:ribonuclease BN (tRNA processing enzyme)